jgi:hypothetical protein
MWRIFGEWVKSGQVCRGVDVSVSLFSRQYMREVSLAPRPVYHRDKYPLYISRAFSWSHSGLWNSHTATRVGNVCHRKTCSRGSVYGFHFAPLQLHFLLWQQHSVDVSIATLGVLWLYCTCTGTVTVLHLWGYSDCPALAGVLWLSCTCRGTLYCTCRGTVSCTCRGTLSCTCSWFYALSWSLCCWLLMCVCEVQFSSWRKTGQSFVHIPLSYAQYRWFFNNFIECCIMLSVWGVFVVRETNMMHTS